MVSIINNVAEKLGNSSRVRNALTKLGGANNKATYSIIAIAIAKGIFRPIFTLSDKNESKETKRYAALREGVTELIAIPSYLASDKIATKIAKEKVKFPWQLEMAEKNSRFVGLCLTTLVVIPGLCSCFVKPFTNILMKNSKPKPQEKPKKTSFTGHNNEVRNVHTMNYNMRSYTNFGMRIY